MEMKMTSRLTTKVNRRNFLGAGTTGLALMGIPGRVMWSYVPNYGAGPPSADPDHQAHPVFLARDGHPTANIVVPPTKTVLGRMAEKRLVGAVKKHSRKVTEAFSGYADFPLRSDRNTLVLGTPRTSPLVAKLVEE